MAIMPAWAAPDSFWQRRLKRIENAGQIDIQPGTGRRIVRWNGALSADPALAITMVGARFSPLLRRLPTP
jgi:hypothetical protein